MFNFHQPLFVFAFPIHAGVRIQWETTLHTVSEDSGIVQLVLLKVGETTFSASVEIMTVAISATGL